MFRIAATIGHRGLAAVAPENTLAGIRAASAAGLRWIEVDARPAKDGVAMLSHDDRLRLQGGGWTRLSARSAAQIGRLRMVSPRYPRPDQSAVIPTLAAALDLAAQLRLGVVLEIKARRGGEARACAAVVRALDDGDKKRRHRRNRLIASSFNRGVLRRLRARLPDLPLALNADKVPADWRRLPGRGIANLHLHRAAAADASILAAAGLGVYCFTVNNPAEKKRLLACGVHGIFTDTPDCAP